MKGVVIMASKQIGPRVEDVDYRRYEGADLLHALGDDARKWAEAFLQMNPDATIDQETLICWFANAIEHSYDMRTGRVHNGDHAQYLIDKKLKPM